MNPRILFTSLLILSLVPLAAQACPTGNSQSLAYIRRDNNRCEGLREQNASASFGLISFSTSTLSSYPDRLTLRVPGTGSTPPTVALQSFYRKYLLDNISPSSSAYGYTFNLDTRTVLKAAEIPITRLRALAYTTRDSNPIYFPVILGSPDSQYQFVLSIPQRTTLPKLEIRYKGQAVFKKPQTNPQEGEFSFNWKYGNADAGTYELYIEDGEGQHRTFRFQHNPDWL
ncbi:MAG: hypothetical protein KME15_17735 [Drouetiella hepatica Uher 2000/2452]|jgi:flagellar basal-body rod modification protein FlgD|uniref:Uncharacterized protein n=1 Tax=Drouetiella hepatica Uher 2000/2452 TaxID=904376 RepID=A0A951UN99_9CYAN|nr:hypothetical protein [Drouetiella hepatica Uher 2000/2452]